MSRRNTVPGCKTNFGEKGKDVPDPCSGPLVLCLGISGTCTDLHSPWQVSPATPFPGWDGRYDAAASQVTRWPRTRGRCLGTQPGRATVGNAAAGPTSAARMRRLFSSVQRSERTLGCARSSSAAASTQPAVQAAKASSAPRRQRPHRAARPRVPAARAIASPALGSPLRSSRGGEGEGRREGKLASGHSLGVPALRGDPLPASATYPPWSPFPLSFPLFFPKTKPLASPHGLSSSLSPRPPPSV